MSIMMSSRLSNRAAKTNKMSRKISRREKVRLMVNDVTHPTQTEPWGHVKNMMSGGVFKFLVLHSQQRLFQCCEVLIKRGGYRAHRRCYWTPHTTIW